MKVLLTGAQGMLGRALMRSAPAHVVVQAYDRKQLDIVQADQVEQAVMRCKPDVIINAAAYTQVDRAEAEPEKAYAVNRDGALHLAQMAARLGVPLLHFSTDYVFDGVFSDGVCRPYTEEDVPNPLNVYGASKLAGERAVLAAHEQALIIRTSSLFDSQGCGADFMGWVLAKAREEKMKEQKVLRVVDSWVSCPTPVESLAGVVWLLVDRVGMKKRGFPYGVYHYAGMPAVSRYDWACEIIKVAQQKGLVAHDVEVIRCSVEELPLAAKRPVYSALDCGRIQRVLGIGLIGKKGEWRSMFNL